MPNKDRSDQHGFTLIELIAILVILGIIASIGSRFLVTTVDSYKDIQERSKIVNHGRLVIEQMSRQLRIAMPNSVRVSASGNCVEFMPLVAGVNYLTPVPDSENLAPAVGNIPTAPYSITGNGQHASVGALSASEVYATGSPNSRVGLGALGAGPVFTQVNFSSSHRFIRNSVNKRVFLAADPMRFCLFATSLVEYSGYGLLTSSLTDLDPGGNSSVMAEGVGSNGAAFVLSQGTENVNTALDISLVFTRGSNQLDLNQQVLIRNVP